MHQHHQLLSLLTDIEAELQRLSLWQTEPPPAAALASAQPFAIDTLPFEGWLQFMLIPRMRTLLLEQQTLPGQCHTAEMAETMWVNQAHHLPLVALLRQFDQLLNSTAES